MTIGKEIVTIQVGQCGNTLGREFWEDVCKEHGLCSTGYWSGEHSLQLEGVDCLFVPGANGRNYVPRCVLLDLDPSSLSSIRCSPNGQIFRPDNFIFGHAGSGNNFARAYYTAGTDIKDMALDAIRHEMEMCDHPVGFQMLGALGGGTGSGLGGLILQQLKDDYNKMVMVNYSIIPGGVLSGSDAVVEPINATLACPSLVKYSDITVCMDNQCLYDICQKTLRLDTPLYQDINEVMARVISGLSATYRFPSKNYVGWKSMKCVMVPAPKLHFFAPGFVPLNPRGVQCYRNFSVHDITYQLLNGPDILHTAGIQRKGYNGGKYITGLTIYRGYSVPEAEVIEQLAQFEYWNTPHFVPWMPYHFIKGICELPPPGMKISCTFLANHTGAQKNIWGNILDKYQSIFKRKAFLHWFYAEGMGEDDFKTAEEEVTQLLEEYISCEEEAPKDWVPMDNSELFHKCLEEEELERVLDTLMNKKPSVDFKPMCSTGLEVKTRQNFE